jgi:hypothetical protein
VIVGLAVLLRRGWRMAALHTAPLALCFAVWWFTFGREDYGVFRIRFRAIPGYVVSGFDATFDALGQLPWAGFALVVMLIAGLFLAWGRLDRDVLRRRAAVPAALLVGPAVMMAINALGRPFGTGFAREGRWSHLLAAFCLPAIAVAADAIVRRSRALAPVAVGLLLIGIPGNVDAIVDYDRRNAFALGSKDLILTLPQMAVAREVPREMKPLRKSAREVTVGWLLDGADSGRIPAPQRIDPVIAARATLLLSLEQRLGSAPTGDCRVVRTPVRLRMNKGDAIGFEGGKLSVTFGNAGANAFFGATYDPDYGRTLHAVAGPLELRLASPSAAAPVELCV